MGIKLPNPDSWKRSYKREISLLGADVSLIGRKKYFSEAIESDFKGPYEMIIVGSVIVPKDQDELIVECLRKKGFDFYKKLYDKTIRQCNLLLDTVQKNIRNPDLLEAILLCFEEFYNAVSFFWLPWYVTEYNLIFEGVDYDEKKIEKILLFNLRKDYIQQERFELLKLATKKNQPNFQMLLREHHKKFSWLSQKFFNMEDELPIDYFQEKISEIEDPEELLETKKKEEEHERKTTEQLINQLDDESKERIKLAQDYGYLLNWSVETIYKACFIFNQILKRAEVDLGIKLKDMKYLTSQEIIALKKIDKQHLELKKKGYGYVRTGVKPILLLGKEFKQFQKWSETLTAVDKEISEIKGKGVFEGVVKGQAVIINEDADLKKVQKGDIIVCSMTSPNFVIAMEKAVGWVTDEGGLVCHASVLAREMKKPCIVGTRIATKVIKEGDTIQIDSKKGTVKKI